MAAPTLRGIYAQEDEPDADWAAAVREGGFSNGVPKFDDKKSCRQWVEGHCTR